MQFSMSITAPPLSAVLIIITIRFAKCFIASCPPFDRLGLGFFTLFILFRLCHVEPDR